MRLTLRTMLAYLDDVLEPADAEELGNKINDSEFASGLVHRIRSTMRKLRLGTPKLEGKGMGLDPNTVAEYLDSTLSPDHVPDFEKVCLESDVHLAEVASCHQILTLVLGEPADVSPEVRQRVYRIASLASAAPPTPAKQRQKTNRQTDADATPARTEMSAPAAQPPVSEPADDRLLERVPPAKPEIPDYLRAGSRSRILPYLATGLLVFLIAFVALYAIGPAPIIALFQREPRPPHIDRDDTFDPGTSTPALAESQNAIQSDALLPEVDRTNSRSAVSEFVPGAPAVPSKSVATDATLPKPSTIEPVMPADEPPEPIEIPGVTPPTIPTIAGESTPDVSKPSLPATEGSADRSGPMPEVAAFDLGRYISEKQVLARLDEKTGDWLRVTSNSPVAAGDHLLVLPTYRPQLALASGVQLTFAGESRVQLHEPKGDGVPSLSIEYGRLRLLTIGRAGAQIALKLGGRSGMVTFGNADATMAVEVRRWLPPGSNPETDPAQTIVQIAATGGQIMWEERGELITMAAGNVHVMIDDDPGRTVKVEEFAAWVSSTGPSGIDQTASTDLEGLIDEKRPIVVSLEERVSHPRVETRTLAARCLSYLERHEPFVKMLNDADSKSFWEPAVETVQDVLAHGPVEAAALRAALRKLRGADGDSLYRLLWGYSQKQLRDERAGETLVDYLSHESMDFRVLAFLNLKRITTLTYVYNAHFTASRRATAVKRWRDTASAGEIVYKEPPKPPLPKALLEPPAATPPAKTTPETSPTELPKLAPAESSPPTTK